MRSTSPGSALVTKDLDGNRIKFSCRAKHKMCQWCCPQDTVLYEDASAPVIET
jgi:hypothetical protein